MDKEERLKILEWLEKGAKEAATMFVRCRIDNEPPSITEFYRAQMETLIAVAHHIEPKDYWRQGEV